MVRILVVEDEKPIRENIVETLTLNDFEVLSAGSGEEGVKLATEHQPELILCDIMMNGMDGYDVLNKVRSNKHIALTPFIFLTAISDRASMRYGMELGADDYISKPFIMREVKTRIKNILANRKILHEKFKSNSYLPDLTKTPVNSLDEKLLKNLVQTVENNIDEPTLTVEFLSKELGLSRVHLFRKLKILLGITPTDFIKDFRMKRAASLLQQQKLNVSEIAYSVGFQDVHYFGKCFRKAYGVSPSQYSKDQEDSNRNKQTKVG